MPTELRLELITLLKANRLDTQTVVRIILRVVERVEELEAQVKGLERSKTDKCRQPIFANL